MTSRSHTKQTGLESLTAVLALELGSHLRKDRKQDVPRRTLIKTKKDTPGLQELPLLQLFSGLFQPQSFTAYLQKTNVLAIRKTEVASATDTFSQGEIAPAAAPG